MSTFFCGVLYYYKHKPDHSDLFDSDGYLSFSFKDASKMHKISQKMRWFRIDTDGKEHEFSLAQALSDFYTAAEGDLSSQTLSRDPAFVENKFAVEFL